MRGVTIVAALAAVVLGTWVCVILINGMRKRIETVNRRRKERNDRNGYH